jgi:hypothetical protein
MTRAEIVDEQAGVASQLVLSEGDRSCHAMPDHGALCSLTLMSEKALLREE